MILYYNTIYKYSQVISVFFYYFTLPMERMHIKMKEIILCKYGEISLKGANRSYFEKMLRDILKRRLASYGSFKIYSMQSTVYIEPQNEEADIDSAYRIAKNTFGISAINRAIEPEKNMDAILNTVRTQFMP